MTTPPVNRQRVFGAVAFGFTLIAVIVALLPGCDDSGSDEDNAGSGSKKPGTGESGEGGSRSGSTLSSGTIETAIHFADVTKRTSIDFTYRNGEEAGNFAIIESLGGGAGLFDYDNDGDVDVVVPGGDHFPAARTISGHSTALFRNDGGFDFSDVSAVADINTPGFYSHGIAVTDFDSDGFLDFLVTGYGGLRLYHNMGDGTFEESAQATGLTDSQWSSSAAFADFNGDGHVDLYVAHYVNWSFDNHPLCKAGEEKEVCPPRSFDPLPDTLYLSNGDGSFRDASRDWGLSLKGKGLGVVAGDLDLNGTIEVYVGNDPAPNLLYKNKGKTFEDTSLMSGTSINGGGSADGRMGVG
ncbi:MAG: VCBS repeat-containing protein, partial [Planctomycetes bacterium]|nr:VCBS repeat-containing protein [Planctomycetota bacterium]